MSDKLAGYANYIVETVREKFGLAPDDDSMDDKVLEYLQSGEKISKSKHLGEK
jgi:hypothetical protein